MTKPLIYLAGPYSHPDPAENAHRVCGVADSLQATSLVVCLVPHLTMLWQTIAPKPTDHWYEYDLHLLRRCDALLRLPGDSVGADGEVLFAEEHGIPVFWDEDHLLSWAFVRQAEMAEIEAP